MPVEALLALGALPGLEPLDCLLGDPVVTALLQVGVAGFGAERPLGVGDPVPLAVLLDPATVCRKARWPLTVAGSLPSSVASRAAPARPPARRRCRARPARGRAPGRRPAGRRAAPAMPSSPAGRGGLPVPGRPPGSPAPRQCAGRLRNGEAVAGLGQLPAARQPPDALPSSPSRRWALACSTAPGWCDAWHCTAGGAGATIQSFTARVSQSGGCLAW
jgi:hypothetical protein